MHACISYIHVALNLTQNPRSKQRHTALDKYRSSAPTQSPWRGTIYIYIYIHFVQMCFYTLESKPPLKYWGFRNPPGFSSGSSSKLCQPVFYLLVLSRKCGNERRGPLKGNHNGWFMGFIPSFPTEQKQV